MARLQANLVGCLSIPKEPAALFLIDLLKARGATLLTSAYGRPNKRPERNIEATGSIILTIGIEHPILAKGRFHNENPHVPRRKHGSGSLGYIHSERGFVLDQDAEESSSEHWTQLASGQIEFVRMLYPLLRPRFGWIDEAGCLEARKVIVKGEPRLLFWANIFGPDIVQELGKDFLLKAPGWKKEELDDGGILYVIEAEYFKWRENPSQESLQYFQAKIPQMRIYRAKPAGLPREIVRMVLTDEETGKETVVYERDRGSRRGKKR